MILYENYYQEKRSLTKDWCILFEGHQARRSIQTHLWVHIVWPAEVQRCERWRAPDQRGVLHGLRWVWHFIKPHSQTTTCIFKFTLSQYFKKNEADCSRHPSVQLLWQRSQRRFSPVECIWFEHCSNYEQNTSESQWVVFIYKVHFTDKWSQNTVHKIE